MILETFLAEAEIKSLLLRERYYRDTFQWDEWRDTYHPDASKTWINITWISGNIDDFVSRSKKQSTEGVLPIHSINPVQITFSGSKAVSESLGGISARFVRDSTEYDVISLCRFISRVERVDLPSGPKWKLLTMEAIYVRDSIVPVAPLAGPSTLSIETKTRRKSYRHLGWLLEQQGYTVKQDLPGIDDPEGVKKFIEENRKWLLEA